MNVGSQKGIGVANLLTANLRLHRSDSAHVETLARHLVLHRCLLLMLSSGRGHDLPWSRRLLW